MHPPGSLLKNAINTRRSQRVVARIRVRVRPINDQDFGSEVGYTLVVNAHGALISVAIEVSPDEILTVKNVNTGQERKSRVVRVWKKTKTDQETAIEFAEPAPRFWSIDFPPADWKNCETAEC